MKKKHKTYGHLTRAERHLAYTMRSEGFSFREICLSLSRPETAAGSLCREFKRNLPVSPLTRKNLSAISLSNIAHQKALERRAIPRKKELLVSDVALRNKVLKELEDDQASPRDIRLRVLEDCPGKSVSHTTIYSFVKKYKPELKKHFRLRAKPRRQHVTKRKKPKDKSVSRRSIAERIIFAEHRLEFGHFEIDTVVSCRGGSGFAILSIREMKSRMRWFFLITDLKAETTLAVVRGFFSRLPKHMIKTLTADNGAENKDLYKLEQDYPGLLKVYYCDPYCAHQRGAVENSNGEFRWYYPKGTDFKDVCITEIWKVQDKLNRRRMDCLGGKTANEVFQDALLNPPLIKLAQAESLSDDAIFQLAFLPSVQHAGLFLPV